MNSQRHVPGAVVRNYRTASRRVAPVFDSGIGVAKSTAVTSSGGENDDGEQWYQCLVVAVHWREYRGRVNTGIENKLNKKLLKERFCVRVSAISPESSSSPTESVPTLVSPRRSTCPLFDKIELNEVSGIITRMAQPSHWTVFFLRFFSRSEN